MKNKNSSTIDHQSLTIALDVSQMCYEGTGVARYVYGLTKALLLSGSKHDFTLYAGALRQRSFFTNLSITSPWNQASWKIVPLPPKLTGLILNSLPIPFELLTGPADLIHTSDWSEPYSRLPMVTTVHDLVFQKYPETLDSLIVSTQQKRLARICKNQTHIIVDSLSTKNDLIEIYNLPSSRIQVVYPGISSLYFPQSKQEIDRVKTKYKLPDQFILSLGTQEPRKNLARLKEAVVRLNIPLVVVGKYGWGGPITPGVKGSHTPGVLSLGYVPDSDLPALYSGATVFVYPSLYEGFGFPVLEAMACGTPVVTSNISSLPEVAGNATILVDPLDAPAISSGIKQALKSRDKLIHLGLNQAKKFTWESTAKQVLEVYDKIIDH